MEATKEDQQQDVLMQLYDLYWFKHHILTNQPAIEEEYPNPKLFHKTTSLHPVRSSSDKSLSSKDPINFSGAHSPRSVLTTSTFYDESSYDNVGEQVKKSKRRSARRCCGISKSLSEIKGLIDLGFEFSEEDIRCPRMVSILPGLQRLEAKEGVLGRSDLWRVRKKPFLLVKKNLRLPSLCNEDDMKNYIKVWAQAVASSVGYEHEFGSISSS